MIYVYRRASSSGARELVDALMEAGLPSKRWSDKWKRTPKAGDRILCWGEGLDRADLTILNGAPVVSKLTDALKLASENISTIEVSRARPENRPVDVVGPAHRAALDAAQEFAEHQGVPLREAVVEARDYFTRLIEALDAPAAPVSVWLGRKSNHVGGMDLLNPPDRPDYWVKQVKLVEEYRLHIFQGKSIRAGIKVPREGFSGPGQPPAHAWVRSYEGGWRIRYDDFKSSKKMRELAAGAVKALNLDFGAVDLGKREDGNLMVLEVNRAPGLEGGTVEAYVEAIQKWVRGE